MKVNILLLCITSALCGMEKNGLERAVTRLPRLPQELKKEHDEFVVQLSTLPDVVKRKIFSYYFDYANQSTCVHIPSINSYGLIKEFIPENLPFIQKAHRDILKKQHNFATQGAKLYVNGRELYDFKPNTKDNCLYSNISANANNLDSRLDKTMAITRPIDIRYYNRKKEKLIGPNCNGLVFATHNQQLFQVDEKVTPYNRTDEKEIRQFIKCIHPNKNKLLMLTRDDTNTVISQYYTDDETNNLIREYTKGIVGLDVSHVQYDYQSKESENLIGIHNSRTIIKIDTSGDQLIPAISKLVAVDDLIAPKLYEEIAQKHNCSVEQMKERTYISNFQISKKHPQLFLVTVCIGFKHKSFLCDMQSTGRCIKEFNIPIDFCQPLDTLIYAWKDELAPHLLTFISADDLEKIKEYTIAQGCHKLNSLAAAIIKKWQPIAQLFNKQNTFNQNNNNNS